MPCAVLIVRQWAIAHPLPVVLRVVVGLLLSVCGSSSKCAVEDGAAPVGAGEDPSDVLCASVVRWLLIIRYSSARRTRRCAAVGGNRAWRCKIFSSF